MLEALYEHNPVRVSIRLARWKSIAQITAETLYAVPQRLLQPRQYGAVRHW